MPGLSRLRRARAAHVDQGARHAATAPAARKGRPGPAAGGARRVRTSPAAGGANRVRVDPTPPGAYRARTGPARRARTRPAAAEAMRARTGPAAAGATPVRTGPAAAGARWVRVGAVWIGRWVVRVGAGTGWGLPVGAECTGPAPSDEPSARRGRPVPAGAGGCRVRGAARSVGVPRGTAAGAVHRSRWWVPEAGGPAARQAGPGPRVASAPRPLAAPFRRRLRHRGRSRHLLPRRHRRPLFPAPGHSTVPGPAGPSPCASRRRSGRPGNRARPWVPCPRWSRRTAAPTSRPQDARAFPPAGSCL